MSINEPQLLSCVEINPTSAIKKCIIWLHGLGADGNDFVPIVDELNLPTELGVRFVFPHAPVIPVTINNGFEMRAWFDILGLSIASQVDKTGIKKSVRMIEQLIAREEKLHAIKSSDIILAGFSQGAIITLTAGIESSKPLAGMLALSGCLPLAEEVLQNAQEVNRKTPIFIAHGTQDAVVPFPLGQTTAVFLQQARYSVTWHSYPMGHTVCLEEINDMRKWMLEIFSK